MDKTALFQTLQQGLHVTVGATATLIETIQDPQKRTETLSELQSTLHQQAQQWSEKGLVTEEEARRFIDAWLAKYKPSGSSSSSSVTESSGVVTKCFAPNHSVIISGGVCCKC